MPEEGGVVLNRGAEIQASLKRFESMPSPQRRNLSFRTRAGPHRIAGFVPLSLASVRSPQSDPARETAEMPDLSGRSLREAIVLLAQMGLAPRIGGHGPMVGGQSPNPGEEVSPGGSCTLTLTEERP